MSERSMQAIWAIGQVLDKRDGETALEAAERVSASLADIARRCSATDDETPYEAVGRLMDDYRDVVRQRDRLVAEHGAVEWNAKRVLSVLADIGTELEASRFGRAALSAARACGALASALRRGRRS